MKHPRWMFFRYVIASVCVAAIDYLIFWASQYVIPGTAIRVFVARFVAILVQYILVNFQVFSSRLPGRRTFPLYVLLVVVNGLIVSQIIVSLSDLGVSELIAKLIAELILYIPGYWISKAWIFKAGTDQPEELQKSQETG